MVYVRGSNGGLEEPNDRHTCCETGAAGLIMEKGNNNHHRERRHEEVGATTGVSTSVARDVEQAAASKRRFPLGGGYLDTLSERYTL